MGASGSGKSTLMNILAAWTGQPRADICSKAKTFPGSTKRLSGFATAGSALFFKDSICWRELQRLKIPSRPHFIAASINQNGNGVPWKH